MKFIKKRKHTHWIGLVAEKTQHEKKKKTQCTPNALLKHIMIKLLKMKDKKKPQQPSS
jgi:hypothetical protein